MGSAGAGFNPPGTARSSSPEPVVVTVCMPLPEEEGGGDEAAQGVARNGQEAAPKVSTRGDSRRLHCAGVGLGDPRWWRWQLQETLLPP